MAIDFLVLGAGMAGAAAGYFLADHGEVVILEREDVAGYHSTGRSAALYIETYGNAAIRALTVASGPFFRSPPAGFAATPRRLAPAEALALCPVLREDWLAYAFCEPDAMDMDVHAIHQGFLRGLRAKGGRLLTAAAPRKIARAGGLWQVETAAASFAARCIVDAAGAWADEVAGLAGLRPVGLQPLRRTACLVAPPTGLDTAHWPVVIDAAESFYFKPESGRLLIS